MGLDNIIEFKNVSILIKDHMVFKSIDLTIQKGEFVYIIGKVGSGKTTLIKTITSEIPVAEGNAVVAGYNLESIKRKHQPMLRRKVGVVFQDFQLLSDRTVNDNLSFVLKATGWKSKTEINTRIGEVLEKVGLGYKGYKFPHQLSGGEQQRVVIARALLNNPEIILADEPTGNLDPKTSEEIIEILQDLSKNGRAVIMVTHNYNLLKKFPSRILKCYNEGVIETDLNDPEIEHLSKQME
ncbi:MAG: ATP-binding cassette domain-containing protein [Bacteroidales bacterium]|nr:ATP-binding cassette domain-containing protein [Bacteroidales bacterium]MCF8390849.1 ATP-binding cassette domain-containing protein [Bacteroidales bacterium]